MENNEIELDPLAQALVETQKKQIAQLGDQINVLAQQVGENRKRIDAVYEKIDELTSDIHSEISEFRADVTKRFDITNQRIDNETNSLRSEISDVHSEISVFRTDVTERIDQVVYQISSQTKWIIGLMATIGLGTLGLVTTVIIKLLSS